MTGARQLRLQPETPHTPEGQLWKLRGSLLKINSSRRDVPAWACCRGVQGFLQFWKSVQQMLKSAPVLFES